MPPAFVSPNTFHSRRPRRPLPDQIPNRCRKATPPRIAQTISPSPQPADISAPAVSSELVLSGSASSGLSLVYAINSTNAASGVSGSNLLLSGSAGTILITAFQPGDARILTRHPGHTLLRSHPRRPNHILFPQPPKKTVRRRSLAPFGHFVLGPPSWLRQGFPARAPLQATP